MTSASELFYNRRSLRSSRAEQVFGPDPSLDRSFHQNYPRRHYHHSHRHDLDACDPSRRPQNPRLCPRGFHYVRLTHFSRYYYFYLRFCLASVCFSRNNRKRRELWPRVMRKLGKYGFLSGVLASECFPFW